MSIQILIIVDKFYVSSLYQRSVLTATILLLRTYQKMKQKFNDGKISHKKCWERVSKSLKDHEYNITSSQCASKKLKKNVQINKGS